MHTVLSSLPPVVEPAVQRPPNLQRTAQTVERFLNALRLADDSARTELEETLVRWLVDGARLQEDHLVYQQFAISCYSRGHMIEHYEVPWADQTRTLWCNARKLSAIDGPAFTLNAQLIMQGTGGLVLTLPVVA